MYVIIIFCLTFSCFTWFCYLLVLVVLSCLQWKYLSKGLPKLNNSGHKTEHASDLFHTCMARDVSSFGHLAPSNGTTICMTICIPPISRILNTLCSKSPSARGFDACLPVCLLFKSIKHNAFYPVSSTQFKCRIAAKTKPGKMHCVLWI